MGTASPPYRRRLTSRHRRVLPWPLPSLATCQHGQPASDPILARRPTASTNGPVTAARSAPYAGVSVTFDAAVEARKTKKAL